MARPPHPEPAPSIEVDPVEVGAPLGDGPARLEARQAPAPDGLWFVAAVLWRRRWPLVGLTVAAAVAGVALSLALPKWYLAETRVMLPESGGSSMTALIESVAPGAGSLLGGEGGDYTRYLAILTSRTLLERVVEQFDLVERYETGEKPDPVAAAVKGLSDNTVFDVSLEYNHLSIQVLDQDPRVAAQIANQFVAELNRANTQLSSESAREQRLFVAQRLREAEVALDSVRGDLQRLQESYGIAEPASQGEAMLGAISQATSLIATADVQYQALRSELGDENPQTIAARAALDAARGQLDRLTSGGSEMMPVPIRQLPQVGRQYAQLQQEMLIQAKIIEFVRPMYEQALFDERRTTSAVQVIDEAVPPARKARPQRAAVVLAFTLSAFVLLCVWFVGLAALREMGPRIRRRLQTVPA